MLMKLKILFWFFPALLSTLAQAYPDADQQGGIYRGLQDIHGIALSQGINPESTEQRWQIGNTNLMEWLLAPWNPQTVNEQLARIKSKYGSIAAAVRHVAAGAMTNIYTGENNFDASGHQLTLREMDSLLTAIGQAHCLDHWQQTARAITLSDADALFVPVDTFITKNLRKSASAASDQKSSSTLIAANTPVFVLGQVNPIPNLNPAEDSWLIVWRPEFGLKFVKSRHVAFADQPLVERYSLIQSEGSTMQLKMTTTSRVREGINRLSIGTPILAAGDGFMMARLLTDGDGDGDRKAPSSDTALNLNHAYLTTVSLTVADPHGILDNQVQAVPLTLNNRNLLGQISNNILKYPAEYVSPIHNENRSFAWGEGTIGPDGERGQDASTMILKSVRPFGWWLPRYSRDQVQAGTSHRLVASTHNGTLEENYRAMVTHCTLGNFVSWGVGSNMICLGNTSLQALALLDPHAAKDAIDWGGLSEEDPVPLLASTSVGLTTMASEENLPTEQTLATPQWFITGKSAVYPVFKQGYLDSFIRDGRSLTFFSYFTPLDEATAADAARGNGL